MDSADSDPLRAALQVQAKRINQQEEQLSSFCTGVREMSARHESFQASISGQMGHSLTALSVCCGGSTHLFVSRLTQSRRGFLQSLLQSLATQALMTDMANPEPFSGDSGNCKPFLVQCVSMSHC